MNGLLRVKVDGIERVVADFGDEQALAHQIDREVVDAT